MASPAYMTQLNMAAMVNRKVSVEWNENEMYTGIVLACDCLHRAVRHAPRYQPRLCVALTAGVPHR
eukprot:COSAG01_NODE_3217_length_6400_cov_4.602444_5_plen_66_part_00